MKRDNRGFRLKRHLSVITGLILLQSCGVSSDATSRIFGSGPQSAYAVASGEFTDPEDIVSVMLAPESVQEQDVTPDDADQRLASLIPLDQVNRDEAPLIVDDGALSLDASELEEAREQADLRAFDTPVKNQGSRPWCTAFATIGAVENLGRQFFDTSMDLSEIHHFKSYAILQTPPSLNSAKTRGFIDESLWPYYGNKQPGADAKVRAKLAASKKIQLTLSDVVSSLREGYPVVINLDVNGSFMRPKAGGIIVPGGARQGGHAIALSGVVVDNRVGGGGYFVVKNSWGSSWGDKGYGYVPFSYCKYSYCYAWAISDITVNDDAGKLREKIPAVRPKPDPVPAPLPMPDPVPDPDTTPAPRPEDKPTPVVDPVSAEGFSLVSSVRDYRGLFGAHFFVLNVKASPEIMKHLKSVVYRVEGQKDFRAMISNNAGGAVPVSATSSRSYRIWGRDQVNADATVYLKDGRSFDLRDVLVSF